MVLVTLSLFVIFAVHERPEDYGYTAEELDQANAAVSRAESIRAWRLLDTQFTEQSGHMTPSMKLKRAIITRDFAEQIEGIYSA